MLRVLQHSSSNFSLKRFLATLTHQHNVTNNIATSSHIAIGSTSTSRPNSKSASNSALTTSSSSTCRYNNRQLKAYFSSPTNIPTNNIPTDLSSTTSSDGLLATPINFDIASSISGNESQILTINLYPNQILRAESGAMMYMTDNIQMNTTTGGGISQSFKRYLTGQNLFISDYTYTGEEGTYGTVCLGTDFPSKILRLNVDEYGGKIICQKGALLCSSHTIDIEMEFTKKFSTGFFGGEGFVLQGLIGKGDVFVKAGGTLIRRDLDEGEVLRISSGCLVAFTPSIEYDIQMMQGFKNVLFGGEGLFITTFTGPGTVWLQGQPPQRMISEIARRVPSGGGIGFVPVIGGGDGGGEEGNVSDDAGDDSK